MLLFKKKTREESIEAHTQEVLRSFIHDSPLEFTELELVQMINKIRLDLVELLRKKRLDYISKSTEQIQRSEEIKVAIDLIE